MSSYLFIDPVLEDKRRWSEVIEQVKNESIFSPYKQCGSPWEVYLQLITSLIIDEPVILFDSDFSAREIKEIDISEKNLKKKISYKFETVPASFEEFCENLKDLQNWSITLFTSGTTGQPKKIIHDFESITRGAKVSDNYRNHIWGWAYNATHMAGIQVFFQAMLNGNPLVSLFGNSKSNILSAIESNRVTHLSATPTFYRMLLPIDAPIHTVKSITFGGERIDEHLKSQLIDSFPEATFRNVYASTEAGSLFSTEGAYFRVSSRFNDLVKFSNNELCLHRNLLGEAENLSESDTWYNTGDLVEFSKDDPQLFKFLSRKNEMINVGGYKVNPHEVEEVLNAHSSVNKSLVYGKKNPILGNIVMAEVEATAGDITEKDLRIYLEERLQSFKVPRMIKFVEQIPLTRTGKVTRKQ